VAGRDAFKGRRFTVDKGELFGRTVCLCWTAEGVEIEWSCRDNACSLQKE